MEYIKPITFSSLKDISNNIEQYSNILVDKGVLVFRAAHLNDADQEQMQLIFGEHLGYYPNKKGDSFDIYIENHSMRENITSIPKTMNIIDWHIENPYYDNPIVSAVWNMKVFDLPSDCGTTLFVDTLPIIAALPLQDYEFLQKCSINVPYELTHPNTTKLLANNKVPLIQPPLSEHWITKQPVPRFFLGRPNDGGVVNKLAFFDNKPPTLNLVKEYERIVGGIITAIKDDNKALVHQWEEGDVLIADLHRMAHTVKGGIDPSKREFRGLWAYQRDLKIHPYVDAESRLGGAKK